VRPGSELPEAPLSAEAREHAAALMRVNHVGEICAQALYQGQALATHSPGIRDSLQEAAAEEQDHLAWCADRIGELGGRTSLLGPFWYLSSFALGAAAGVAGDRWNLAFLAETERQVALHLDGHLSRLPDDDSRSRAVVREMRDDEARHRQTAIALGAAELPEPMKAAMRVAARFMTTVSYRI
jgi:ubiquinone biosynthesis monooxygenase Coq7